MDSYWIDAPISLLVQKILNPAGELHDKKGVSAAGFTTLPDSGFGRTMETEVYSCLSPLLCAMLRRWFSWGGRRYFHISDAPLFHPHSRMLFRNNPAQKQHK